MEAKRKYRIGISAIFFLSGLCLATLTSRIPTIKSTFDLNEAELASLLLVMPISSILGLPLSGWLVERYETRLPILWGGIMICVCIIWCGFANDVFWLGCALFSFSMFNRILNIAMNTQALTVQKLFNKKINGSFHGLWSVGGIVGVGISTGLVSLDVDMSYHFLMSSALALVLFVMVWFLLISGDHSTSQSKVRLGKPDPYILALGMLVFLAAITEGGMFDWSGVYFKEVVQEEVFTVGYLTFMMAMASSRFVSDRLIDRFGMKNMYVVSASFSLTGFMLAVLLPYYWTAMLGFTLVGFGTASIIPMTFTLAGDNKKYSPGMAISIIATYGMVGVLAGPPIIGYIAHLINLQTSFAFMGFGALMIIPVSRIFFRLQQK
jgi:MFS family permease